MTIQPNTAESRHRLIIRDSQRVCVISLTTRSAMVFRMKILFWKKRDIIIVDVSTILDGYFQMHPMFMIGKAGERAEKLVRVTEWCRT